MNEGFRWDESIQENLKQEAIRAGYDVDNIVKAAYTPTIRIQSYGYDVPFGEYHKETSELKILDAAMVGDTNLELIKQHLDEENQEGNLFGHHMMIGIPKDVYDMREKYKYDRDLGGE